VQPDQDQQDARLVCNYIFSNSFLHSPSSLSFFCLRCWTPVSTCPLSTPNLHSPPSLVLPCLAAVESAPRCPARNSRTSRCYSRASRYTERKPRGPPSEPPKKHTQLRSRSCSDNTHRYGENHPYVGDKPHGGVGQDIVCSR